MLIGKESSRTGWETHERSPLLKLPYLSIMDLIKEQDIFNVDDDMDEEEDFADGDDVDMDDEEEVDEE